MKFLMKMVYFYLFCSCSLQARISEKIYFFRNFSGSYQFELNLNQSNYIFKLINKVSASSKDLKSENFNTFHDIANYLKDINGIKNIKIAFNHDFSKLIIGFNFKNISSLNEALKIIYGRNINSSINLKKGTLSRTFRFEKNESEIDDQDFDKKYNKKIFLKDIIISTEYSFENLYIRKKTTGFSNISSNKKNVLYNYFLLDITSKSLEHSIYLSNL